MIRRLATSTIAAALAVGMLVAAPAAADEGFRIERVAGEDRYETAAFAALAAFPAGADAVVLARGDDFPDALAGAYLAGQLGGPVLLTQPAELPEVTATAIETLGATQIYLLGGPAAISPEVEEGFGEEFTVTRVQGTTRYGTAAAAVP
jgi:putative cell wall-binding protein